MVINNVNLDWLNVKPGDRVLDLGCGRGEHTIQLAQAGFDVVGADPDPALLEILRHNTVKANVLCEAWLLDVQGGVPEPGKFDAVVCTEVLEHVPDYRRALAEIARALRPDGRACIAVPTACTELILHRLHPYYVQDSTHVNVFTKRLLTNELERAGFRILHTEGRNFEWTAFWLLHGQAHSRFDHTGTPTENERLTERFWRFRHGLMRLRLDEPIRRIGNRVLPKSLYVYAERGVPRMPSQTVRAAAEPLDAITHR
jgi:SAM-dependent methyltransferase